MNRNIIIILLAALSVSLLTNCKEAILATGISLDQEVLSIPVDSVTQLLATLEPEGAEGNIEWSSSDPSVAAVSEGIVTALKTGTATIAAVSGAFSAKCEVTVTPKTIDPNNLPASLRGTDYYLIHMDGTTAEFIDGKITHDFRPDEENKFLYIWENTFQGGTSTGLNYYGFTEGWISLIVGNVGWSGGGYFISDTYGDIDMTNLFDSPDDYTFHIALKSAQEGTSYTFIFTDGTSEAKVVVGPVPMENIVPYTDFARDNEWHEVEIPVSYLRDLGLFYNAPFKDVNIFAFLGGSAPGTTLDMDAIFFYRKE